MNLPSSGEGHLQAVLPDTPRVESLRFELRSATQDAHACLDRRLDGMMESHSPALYHRFIRMNHACHRALLPALATGNPGLGTLADLGPALDRDMADMGLRPLPLPEPESGPHDPASRAGILYVLAGSHLGARFLLRAFEKTAPPWRTQAGTRYLRLAATSRPFPEFMAPFDVTITHPEDRAAACRSARRAFGLFADCLALAEAEMTP